jgi:iron complex outermembrane receptor protein
MNKKLIVALVAGTFSAVSQAEGINLNPVVVTATRVEQNSFDLPVSIDVVDKSAIRDGQLQMTLSESLIRVPGITAQNRNQQAQDPQLSTRGFGSRSSFGVRGVRIYVDGIPLTMPDGQGQPGVVDLSAIKRIEVMRGPFSSLYGNSSGGVIQMISEDAPKTPEVGTSLMYGSYGTQREVLNAAGTEGIFEYMLNISNFDTDGYRDHSASRKKQATAKFKFNFSDTTKLIGLTKQLKIPAA